MRASQQLTARATMYTQRTPMCWLWASLLTGPLTSFEQHCEGVYFVGDCVSSTALLRSLHDAFHAAIRIR